MCVFPPFVRETAADLVTIRRVPEGFYERVVGDWRFTPVLRRLRHPLLLMLNRAYIAKASEYVRHRMAWELACCMARMARDSIEPTTIAASAAHTARRGRKRAMSGQNR